MKGWFKTEEQKQADMVRKEAEEAMRKARTDAEEKDKQVRLAEQEEANKGANLSSEKPLTEEELAREKDLARQKTEAAESEGLLKKAQEAYAAKEKKKDEQEARTRAGEEQKLRDEQRAKEQVLAAQRREEEDAGLLKEEVNKKIKDGPDQRAQDRTRAKQAAQRDLTNEPAAEVVEENNAQKRSLADCDAEKLMKEQKEKKEKWWKGGTFYKTRPILATLSLAQQKLVQDVIEAKKTPDVAKSEIELSAKKAQDAAETTYSAALNAVSKTFKEADEKIERDFKEYETRVAKYTDDNLKKKSNATLNPYRKIFDEDAMAILKEGQEEALKEFEKDQKPIESSKEKAYKTAFDNLYADNDAAKLKAALDEQEQIAAAPKKKSIMSKMFGRTEAPKAGPYVTPQNKNKSSGKVFGK